MKNTLASTVAISLLLASTGASAEVRPAAATFEVMTNDDDVGPKKLGWIWGGVGILVGLGLLVLTDGEPNSPR